MKKVDKNFAQRYHNLGKRAIQALKTRKSGYLDAIDLMQEATVVYYKSPLYFR